MENNQVNKFEIVNFGPYRFIGKSIYLRSKASDNWRGQDEIIEAIRDVNKWVFDEIDALKAYASDIPYNAELVTWDCYNDNEILIFGVTVGKTQLMGYCYGRFMKPDCPVPPGCDYIDIPAGEAAKAWTKEKGFDLWSFIEDEIQKSSKYDLASWRFEAYIHPPLNEEGKTPFGCFMSLHPLSELQIAKRENRAMPPIPAIDVGIWPLPEGQYDPALADVSIPAGARLYGLFDEGYYNCPAPESIPELEKVETLEKLEPGKYCVYTATSGASYVIAISDEPITIMIGGHTPEIQES